MFSSCSDVASNLHCSTADNGISTRQYEAKNNETINAPKKNMKNHLTVTHVSSLSLCVRTEKDFAFAAFLRCFPSTRTFRKNKANAREGFPIL